MTSSGMVELVKNLRLENIPTYYLNRKMYEEAEIAHYESKFKTNQNAPALTPLADEVAKARQRLIETRDNFTSAIPSIDTGVLKFMEKKVLEQDKVINELLKRLAIVESTVAQLKQQPIHQIDVPKSAAPVKKVDDDEDDDGVDLFGSDSEEESEAAAKIREERLAAYAAKKSKKPVLIAKSNVILDVKPWDDETDMKVMEENVRKIETEGLLWGAAKLVPLAYGIKKLQISCVVEDDKVSIDWLTEQIEALEDYVQSVDIAAFNKI